MMINLNKAPRYDVPLVDMTTPSCGLIKLFITEPLVVDDHPPLNSL